MACFLSFFNYKLFNLACLVCLLVHVVPSETETQALAVCRTSMMIIAIDKQYCIHVYLHGRTRQSCGVCHHVTTMCIYTLHVVRSTLYTLDYNARLDFYLLMTPRFVLVVPIRQDKLAVKEKIGVLVVIAISSGLFYTLYSMVHGVAHCRKP